MSTEAPNPFIEEAAPATPTRAEAAALFLPDDSGASIQDPAAAGSGQATGSLRASYDEGEQADSEGEPESVSYDANRDPSDETYADLTRAYDIFNRDLFGGRLPRCLLTLRASGKTDSYFAADRFTYPDGSRAHELAMNPECFALRPIEEILANLVKEMCRLEQTIQGTAGKHGYCNRELAHRLDGLGLIPSVNGMPGAPRVGHSIRVLIKDDGVFAGHAARVLSDQFRARWADRYMSRGVAEQLNATLASRDGAQATEEERQDDPVASTLDSQPLELSEDPAEPEADRREHRIDAVALDGLARQLAQDAVPDASQRAGGPQTSTAATKRSLTPVVSAADLVLPDLRKAIKRKTKYRCPSCATQVWGKPSLQLTCTPCAVSLEEEGASAVPQDEAA